ncbi:hypothetical protein [Burkholderia sp. Ac-20349]|uniref:hypothetical protein n=1 Tax=Burkholderia sp. Ac-20349 TaxID=2703893 RepID=UPI00197B1FE8|nr:hypothetical protein [Burkholderia sp. Ac-20349]MBN3839321.1 hypothetical protein [Burkholderia sp. Ac-20349]
MQVDLFAAPAAEPIVPRAMPQLDDFIRRTQRIYLTGMARRIPAHHASGDEQRAAAETHNARFVLLKLNGMAGEW